MRRGTAGGGLLLALSALLLLLLPGTAAAQNPRRRLPDRHSGPALGAAARAPLRDHPAARGQRGRVQIEPLPEDRGKAEQSLHRLRPPRPRAGPAAEPDVLVRRPPRASTTTRASSIATRGPASAPSCRSATTRRPSSRGDMKAWRAYVREAVRILGRRPFGDGAVDHERGQLRRLARTPPTAATRASAGPSWRASVAADRELRRIGRRDIELGFSFAWRWIPSADAQLLEGDRRARHARVPARARLRRPAGLPRPRLAARCRCPAAAPGDEITEALTLLRGLLHAEGRARRRHRPVGQRERLRDQPRPQRPPPRQPHLASTLDAVHDYSGELGVSDYRYFNLRDNRLRRHRSLRRRRAARRHLRPQARLRGAARGDRSERQPTREAALVRRPSGDAGRHPATGICSAGRRDAT